MSALFLSSCHKHRGPSFVSKCQAHCVASLLHDTDLHWMREGGGAGRWMIESSADSGAGRQAVAQRPEDHVTNCQGTGFIQWLLAAAQLFHIGRSSNRSLPLKQQLSVVAPEPVLCICCFLGLRCVRTWVCLCDVSRCVYNVRTSVLQSTHREAEGISRFAWSLVWIALSVPFFFFFLFLKSLSKILLVRTVCKKRRDFGAINKSAEQK